MKDQTNKKELQMSDKTKAVADAFSKSGTSGKLIIGFIIFAFLSFLFTGWQNVQSNKMYGEFVKQNGYLQVLIENQENVNSIKSKVKKSYDIAIDYFNDDMLRILGTTLAENGISFPQPLNEGIQKYRKYMDEIKDSLITINGNH